MTKRRLFLLFTVGTPTTAAQPPFQPQYVFDYALFATVSAFHTTCREFTFEVSPLHALCVHL